MYAPDLLLAPFLLEQHQLGFAKQESFSICAVIVGNFTSRLG